MAIIMVLHTTPGEAIFAELVDGEAEIELWRVGPKLRARLFEEMDTYVLEDGGGEAIGRIAVEDGGLVVEIDGTPSIEEKGG